ncbi:uncharacterized protein LOC117332465 [Pecten maximus]|uniref:uncharacterized protein LOC117332465 n=1 Tax=Pecten maximus TaxID=6579 RepID=UPI00145814B1|nr:uncharacterized protein LOC117332465 [Pecten maximus]
MATHLPAEIIDIHNTMVLELSENMTGPELKKLKRLLEDDPLTTADKNRIKTVQELFICLRNKAFISYGDYDKLVSKLKLVKPLLCSIVNQYTKDMSKILKPELEKDTKDEISISMDNTVYHTREGSEAAFVECTVIPVPENIVWKKGKSAPLRNLVPIDNRKYFYGPKAPTLVIKRPNKAVDEAQYQCTAEAQGKVADGIIVQLQFSADETKVRETTTNITPPSDDNSTPSVSESELAQPKRERESNKENESSEQVCGSESHTDTLPRGRKRPSSQTEDHSQIGVKRTTVSDADQGCRMSFNVMNDIDITRKESESDISDTFTRVTRQSGRLRKTELKTKCIQVCMCITAAERPSEPSSVHLAEIFKHFLLGGGKIHLSDESHTVLQVDETSLEITSQITLDDDFPYVNTSHGMFNVPVGKTAIIQTYVNASPAATSIQWFKLEDDEHIPIEIDNKIYFGGSVLSPTLIIRETNIDDQGQYMCTATNSNGTGSGNITVLSVQSCHELTSNPEPTEAALQFAVSEDFSLQKQRNIRKTTGKIRALKDITKPPPIRIESRTTCNYHEGSQLDLYCEQCNYLICSKCLSTEEHRSHTTSKLCDITLNQKEDILNFIEKTENIELVHIDQCIASTETQLKENASNFDKLSEQIKIQSNILKEELDLLVAQTLSLYQQMADDNAQDTPKLQAQPGNIQHTAEANSTGMQDSTWPWL